jgi:hypothetical protein
MAYMNAAINDSPTIVDKAAGSMTNPAMLAAVYSGGKLAIASAAGAVVVGIVLPDAPDTVSADDDLTVAIKDIVLWKTGDAIAKGAELATANNGKAVTATSGAFIVGFALDAASAADQVIRVQITKAGYKSGGSVSPLTLAGLTDVDITSVQDGDVIAYDAAAQKYVNKALALKDLSDVDPTLNPTDGQTLTYDGTTDNQWEAKT